MHRQVAVGDMEKFLHDQTIREEHGIEEKCLRHTASEIFPLELRALAIAIFYSLGTLIEGVGAPILFGFLISTNSRVNVALSYGLGAPLCSPERYARS